MDDPTRKTESDSIAILHVLDQVLLRHLERITGTRQGIHGLPMDLMTMTCIVLLMENSEEETDSDIPGGGLDREDFERELKEMGLGDPDLLRRTLEGMAAAGYIDPEITTRIVPEKPVTSMARLLEHAFPGMPGMNLVAYFVQTLDEVETGRKTPADALSQLDQMLRRHGAAPFRRRDPGRQGSDRDTPRPPEPAAPAPSIPQRIPAQPLARPGTSAEGATRIRGNRLVFRSPRPSAAPSSNQTENAPKVPSEEHPPSGDPPEAPSSAHITAEETRSAISEGGQPTRDPAAAEESSPPLLELHPETPFLEKVSGTMDDQPAAEPALVSRTRTQEAEEALAGFTEVVEPPLPPLPAEEPSPPLLEPQPGKPSLEEASGAPEDEPGSEPKMERGSPSSSDSAFSPAVSTAMPPSDLSPRIDAIDPETEVENQIAAFEETLAMQCPVCRGASLEVRKTAKGRVYYQCTSEQCMFISWGLPHHVPCPQCGNPFLVEAVSGSGEVILKCPRATCRYQSSLETETASMEAGKPGADPMAPPAPKAKRRVVRRRVVRKKK